MVRSRRLPRVSVPPAQSRALLVVGIDTDAAPLDDPDALLADAARRERTDLALRVPDARALLARALDLGGLPPRMDPGRRAALELAPSGWRLVALGALDPTHGLDADEGIGPPSAEAQRP